MSVFGLLWSTFFPPFPAFGLNMERYEVSYLSVFSPIVGKCQKNADQNNPWYEVSYLSVFTPNAGNMRTRIIRIRTLKFYKSKFNQTWIKSYPVRAISGDPCKCFCNPCYNKRSYDHQELKDVTYHCKKESHKANVESSKKESTIASFLKSNDSNL